MPGCPRWRTGAATLPACSSGEREGGVGYCVGRHGWRHLQVAHRCCNNLLLIALHPARLVAAWHDKSWSWRACRWTAPPGAAHPRTACCLHSEWIDGACSLPGPADGGPGRALLATIAIGHGEAVWGSNQPFRLRLRLKSICPAEPHCPHSLPAGT